MRHGYVLPCVLAPSLIWAATPTEEEAPVYQVIVTAQKRASAGQDVPFSVAAPTEEQIRKSGATNVGELARNGARLPSTELGHGQTQVTMRGSRSRKAGHDHPGGKETTGLYIDE